MRLLCNTTIYVVESNTLQSAFFCVSSLQIFIPWEPFLVLLRNLGHESHILPDTGPKPLQDLWILVTDKRSFSELWPLHTPLYVVLNYNIIVFLTLNRL